MKSKNKSQRLSFSLNFPTLLKQIKIDHLNPKNLLKLVAKKLKKMKIFALKIVVKN